MRGLFDPIFSILRRWNYRKSTNPDFIRNFDKKSFFLIAKSVDELHESIRVRIYGEQEKKREHKMKVEVITKNICYLRFTFVR